MHDIHTHLYLPQYDADRDAVIARAHAAGIDHMFVIGCTVKESRACVVLAEKYPEIFASVGIHPHEFNEEKSWNKAHIAESIQALKNLIEGSKKIIAIGECGLDYSSHKPDKTISVEQKARQREGFLAQITLASELGLPLIVHCRDAYADMFEILKAGSAQLKAVILHCYMGDTEVTRAFLGLPNVYYSFTGNITYPVRSIIAGTKDDLTETVRLVPLDRLFVETDCPFLAPQVVRGERNEPASVRHVAQAVALFKETSAEVVAEAVSENVRFVFGKLT